MQHLIKFKEKDDIIGGNKIVEEINPNKIRNIEGKILKTPSHNETESPEKKECVKFKKTSADRIESRDSPLSSTEKDNMLDEE